MNLQPKTILNYVGLTLVGLVTLYGIWALAGMAMFVLLIATSPITASFESLALDYSVWAVIALLIFLPGTKLLYFERPLAMSTVWRIVRGYWFYLVPAYGGLLYAVFFISSTAPGYQVVIVIEIALSIWYFANFKKCVIKK